jgi:hypothetical protein
MTHMLIALWREETVPVMGEETIAMAREDCAWGYDQIVGALANIGFTISDQTMGNILKRHGIALVLECKATTTGRSFSKGTWTC